VTQLTLSRRYITLSQSTRRRAPLLVLDLPEAGLVRLSLIEVFPACRRVATFTVRGHRGTNEIPLRRKLTREPLNPGTYEIGVRNPNGVLKRARFAVFASAKPSNSELRTALQRSNCGSSISAAASASGSRALPQVVARDGTVDFVLAAAAVRTGRDTHSRETAARGAPERVSRMLVPPMLDDSAAARLCGILLLAFAALLIAAAATPRRILRSWRYGRALIRHRLEIGVAGIATLLGYAIAVLV
jgi:hypothetical protein